MRSQGLDQPPGFAWIITSGNAMPGIPKGLRTDSSLRSHTLFHFRPAAFSHPMLLALGYSSLGRSAPTTQHTMSTHGFLSPPF